MAFRYEYTYRDFIDAQRLDRGHRKRAMVNFVFWFVGLPLVTLVAVIFTLAAYAQHRHEAFAMFWPIAAWLGFLTLLLVGMRPYSLRKLYRRNLPDGMNFVPVVFSFNDEGIASAIEGRSEGRFFWSAIVDYAENEELALLYVKRKLFVIVPKRAMPENDWQALRMFVHEKAGKPQAPKPEGNPV